MSASTESSAAVRAALSRLIDYAGLFPPAKLDMAPAVAEYIAAREGAHAWMLGRFIVPASRLPDVLAAVPDDAAPVALSVIVDAGTDARAWFGAARDALDRIARVRSSEARVSIEALEVPLPALLTLRETYDATIGQLSALTQTAGLRDLPAFVEVPRDQRWMELLAGTMAAIARARLGAKIRCGGVTADAFPSPAQVAAFLRASAGEKVPFKATAGLHHPIRHTNHASGFVMHGFLNLLAAAAFARDCDAEVLEAILSDEDATSFSFDEAGLRWRDRHASVAAVAAMRTHGFVGYGSCSFDEPVDDLTALSILSKSE